MQVGSSAEHRAFEPLALAFPEREKRPVPDCGRPLPVLNRVVRPVKTVADRPAKAVLRPVRIREPVVNRSRIHASSHHRDSILPKCTANVRVTPGLLKSLAVYPYVAAALLVLLLLAGGSFDAYLTGSIRPLRISFPNGVEPSPVVMKASVESTPVSGPEQGDLVFTRYHVGREETLSRISFKFGLEPSTLISINMLQNPADLIPGRSLLIPYRDGVRVTPIPGESVGDIAARLNVPVDAVQRIPGGTDLFVTGGSAGLVAPAQLPDDMFFYPVDGRVITPYGYSPDSLTGIPYHSEGIDLAVETGTAVRSAGDGRVLLTGNHSSYGLYVIIAHRGGWKTFYGYLERIDVAPGDEISTGTQIGSAGSSGSARTPRLHFVMIRDSHTVDPLDHLF